MKNTLSFVVLIFVALMLLSAVGGVSLWFESVANTWTTEQTDVMARGFSQVIWYGGIVFITILGFWGFLASQKSLRQSRSPSGNQYSVSDEQVINQLPQQNLAQLPPPVEQGNWYEIENINQKVNT